MADSVTPFPGSSHEPQLASDAEISERASLQIGAWLFEPSLNRLSRNSETIRLEPKLTDLLLLLARHGGNVVSKDEIVASVWEGRFIADSALTRAMAELRRALGDDAQAPTYIETISKRGYRLLVEPRAPSSTVDRRPPRARLWTVVAGLLALSAAGALFLWSRSASLPTSRASVSALVVLPLEDLSPDGGAGAYFAAAMTEALTTDLARLGTFRILSRRSLEQFAETRGSMAGVARELGADATVEGTIVRSEGRVRINAQLTAADSGTLLWAGSYDRELVDILSLQSEVARAIAAELSSSVPSGSQSLSTPRVDPLAHDLYLQGRHALRRCFWEGPNESIGLFQRALEVDPDFAPAYAGMANYYATLTLLDFMTPHDGFPKARAAALRALELDPNLAEALAALAHVEFMFDWDWAQAEGGFVRALALNPSSADLLRAYSFFLTCMGRFDEAIEQARREIEVDPLNDHHHLAWVLFNARRYEESLGELVAHQKPGQEGSQQALVGWNYAQLGRHDEAVQILTRAAAKRGNDDPVTFGVLGWALGSAGRRTEALEVLSRLEDLAASETSGDLYPQVLVLAGLGESARALDLLEQAVVQRSPNAIFLAVEPFLDPLATAPRYERLVASVGLVRQASPSGEPPAVAGVRAIVTLGSPV